MKHLLQLLVLSALLTWGSATVASAQTPAFIDAAREQALSSVDRSGGDTDEGEGFAQDGGGNNSHLLLEDDGRVYPNPTTGHLTIEFPAGVTKVEFFNSLGQRITPTVATSKNGHQLSVDMTMFSPGIYFVRLYGLNVAHIHRIDLN